jgi:RNA polymerase-binding transcription factor DksA
MSQPQIFSNSPAKALGIIGADAVNPKGDRRGNIKEAVIAPRVGRKTRAVPKIHCFEFRALLQAQRQKLLANLHEQIAASGEGPGSANRSKTTAGDAPANAAAEMAVAIVIRENQELLHIEAALARIGDGNYGICIVCGGEIGRARLKADPAAMRCLPCQIPVLPIITD